MEGFSKVAPVSAHRKLTSEPKITVRKYEGKNGLTWTANLNRACMAAVGWSGGEMLDVLLSDDGGQVAFVLGDTRTLYETGQIQFTMFQENVQLEEGVYPAVVSDGGVVITKSERRDYVGSLNIGKKSAEADL